MREVRESPDKKFSNLVVMSPPFEKMTYKNRKEIKIQSLRAGLPLDFTNLY